MTASVFADTSGLFAALVSNDRRHGRAEPLLRELLSEGVALHVTSYSLLETFTLLQSRVGLDAALRFESVFQPALQTTWVDLELHQRALSRLERIGSRTVSLVDCCSFVAMEQLGLKRAFGYDPHFTEHGFELLG